MSQSIDVVRKAFERRPAGRLPKGELWLGTDLFKKADLEDNLEGHLALINRLRQDMLCLPVSDDLLMNNSLGYRTFALKEIKEASKMKAIFLAAVVDGPFQRLSEKRGLMKILTAWKQGRREVIEAYEKERVQADILINRCLELSVDAVIIADDLAGERSPFIHPSDIESLLSPFYTRGVSDIHGAHSYAMFHSCGNITRLIPQLVSYGFDGLAAIQHRVNNLISIKERYGSTLTLMTGIEPQMLEAGEVSLSDLKEYEKIVRFLSSGGGFILSSSSGLYSGDFFERILELYRIADGLFRG